MWRRWIVFLLIAASCIGAAPRRTADDVRRERRAASKKIESTRRELSANEEKTRRQLLDLQTLEGEIRQRDLHARDLQRKVNELTQHNRRLADTIAANEVQLKALRRSLANALRAARRQRNMASDASFIFSAGSYDAARSRVRWLRQLSRWQADKARQVNEEAAALEVRRQRLDSLSVLLKSSLDSLSTERRVLAGRRDKADAAVGQLKKQSRNLKRVIEQNKRQMAELDRELDRIIEAERRAAEEAARKARQDRADGSTSPRAPQASPEADMRLTGSFASNKGRLPLPLDRRAVVTSTFGRHTHESLERVEVQNNGIDFDTERGASARAVFDGTVTAVVVMDGFQNVVIVRHGEYLTVYAGLSDLRVRKGDKLKTGDLIGTVFSDPADGGRTRLHFELRHEKDKLDPADWLRH